MSYTLLQTATRIATELRRSNLLSEAKISIVDAIDEASKTRFYFNEMRISFDTIAGEEYYDDLGLVELDAVYYMQGSARYNVEVINQIEMDDLASGSVSGGQLQSISRYQGRLRLYPIPSVIYTLNVDGYGRLLPDPLADDADTNEWLGAGENYIRALAKRNLTRDVVRDFGEARVWESVAEDYKQQLSEATATKMSTGNIRSTQF